MNWDSLPDGIVEEIGAALRAPEHAAIDGRAERIERALAAEMHRHTEPLASDELRLLIGQGVTSAAVEAARKHHPVAIGAGRIATSRNRFAFSPHGEPAFVMPLDEAGYCSDIVAWLPSDPDRWFLRTGAGLVLGEAAFIRAVERHTPLILHSAPLRWIARGGDGAVLLSEAAEEMARGLHEIRVHESDVEYAKALDSRINRRQVRFAVIVRDEGEDRRAG